MIWHQRHVPCFFVFFLISFGLVDAEEQSNAALASLSGDYEDKRDQAFKPVTDLEELYQTNLEKLKGTATKAGKLEHVLALKSELENFRTGNPAAAALDFPEFQRLQSIYRETHAKRTETAQKSLIPLTKYYREQLEILQVNLTKQENLEQAIAVKQVIDGLDKGATVAVDAPSAEGPISRKPLKGLTFTQGRLHGIGKVGRSPSVELDLSKAEGITDFVDVVANAESWTALRANGEVIGWSKKEGHFSTENISKLVQRSFGISTDGQLIDLQTGDPLIKESNIVDAFVAWRHRMVLFDDGTVKAWGDYYEKPISGRQPMPQPPAEALENIQSVCANSMTAWTLNKNGRAVGWAGNGKVFPAIEDITRMWPATYGLLFEKKNGDLLHINESTGKIREVGGPIVTARPGGQRVLGLKDNTWFDVTGGANATTDANGELAKLATLTSKDLPSFYSQFANRVAVISYMLWLSPE